MDTMEYWIETISMELDGLFAQMSEHLSEVEAEAVMACFTYHP